MKKAHTNITAFARLLFFLATLLLLHDSAFSQKKISGIVLDADRQAIDGASIEIKGSKTGTLSAADGSFSILAKTGDVLLISYVGMIQKKVARRINIKENFIN